MKTKKISKKLIAFLLALVVAFSSMATYMVTFARTSTLDLDLVHQDQTSGTNDLIMYKFVPQKSGVYSFITLNILPSEIYLFTKETKEDGSKLFTQIAFSNKSPNYSFYQTKYVDTYNQSHSTNYIHYQTQAVLTYHLDAGKTYYFGTCVQSTAHNATSVTMTSLFVCEGYDDNLIESIEARCPTSLTWYSDGEWKTDSNQEQYYHYNISKIIANTEITVHYTNGTTKTYIGVKEIDGIKVNFLHNQYEKHWLSNKDPKHTTNDLTVKILDKSSVIDVDIQQDNLYPIKGKVLDYATNEPIANARVLSNSQNTSTTDEFGNFAFVAASGTYELVIKTDTSINHKQYLTVYTESEKNDHSASPVILVNCDYVDDDVINTKDSAFVNNSQLSQDVKTKELNKIDKLLGVNADVYK